MPQIVKIGKLQLLRKLVVLRRAQAHVLGAVEAELREVVSGHPALWSAWMGFEYDL